MATQKTVTPAGWELSKTGRLSYPKRAETPYSDRVKNLGVLNIYGDPVVKVGDFARFTGTSISAGTVGRVIAVGCIPADPPYCPNPFWHTDVEMLDGSVKNGHLVYACPLTAEMVQEVKDFYIKDGRPERIKVTW